MSTSIDSIEHVTKLGEPFKDERGVIQPLISMENPQIGSAVMITSKKDTVRANHYHKEDWHYCYIVSGAVNYYYREVGAKGEPVKISVSAGEMIYTPPMLEHAMLFTEDTAFLTMSGGTRKQKDYEADLVRVELV